LVLKRGSSLFGLFDCLPEEDANVLRRYLIDTPDGLTASFPKGLGKAYVIEELLCSQKLFCHERRWHVVESWDVRELWPEQNESHSTRLGVYWSQKPRAPYIPKPKLFKVRIRGVKTISEQNKLAEALHTSVIPETYNGVTLGTHVFSVPSLSAELIEQIKGSPCRVSFHPINFCRNCLQRFSARPSLHKCSSSSSEHPKSEVNEAQVPLPRPYK